MKKLISTIITFLALIPFGHCSNIDILPAMTSTSDMEDRVWVGTFQLIWNDLMDKLVFGEVRFIDGTPNVVYELNKRNFSTKNISEKSYYKYFGKLNLKSKNIIEKGIKKKFNETSDILDKFDWNPSTKGFILYAMLKKDFQFTNEFDKLGKSKFRDTNTEFFGIGRRSNDKLREGVRVLFYNSPDDFDVMLDTLSNDEVYLYKTPNKKTFNLIYSDMLKKEKLFEGETELAKVDILKVPNLKFFNEKSFDELTGQRIRGTQLMIDKALETVKFEMNNTGVKLKSEAAMSVMLTSVGPRAEVKPRLFLLNDTFVIFLKEKESKIPYFALRVHNISNFLD